MRRAFAIAAGALAAVAAAASPAAAGPRTHLVVIDKMRFGPLPATLRPGDVIVWDNRDIFRHTATAANGSFDVDLKAKQKGRTLVRSAGTIAFACKFHPGMRGVLRVSAR